MATLLEDGGGGGLTVEGHHKPISPRAASPRHKGLHPHEDHHGRSRVEELLAKLRDVRHKITSAYNDQDLPKEIKDAMDSKVAELMEKAERRHMLRGALAADMLADDTGHEEPPSAARGHTHHSAGMYPGSTHHQPPPQLAHAHAPGSHSEATAPPSIPATTGAAAIKPVVRSASTTGAVDAEAQIEDYFASFDSSHKEGVDPSPARPPVRRLPTELLRQIHLQAGKTGKGGKAGTQRQGLQTVAEEAVTEAKPTTGTCLPQLPQPSTKLSTSSSNAAQLAAKPQPAPQATAKVPASSAPTCSANNNNNQPASPPISTPSATKPPPVSDAPLLLRPQPPPPNNPPPAMKTNGSSTTLQRRHTTSKATLPTAAAIDANNRAGKEAELSQAAPTHGLLKPSPPTGLKASDSHQPAMAAGKTLGVAMAVVKFKQRARPRSEAARPSPPTAATSSSSRRALQPPQPHRRVTAPAVVAGGVIEEEGEEVITVPPEAWEDGEELYAEARIYR